MSHSPSASDSPTEAAPLGFLRSGPGRSWVWIPIGTLGGLGYAPLAPGTVASLFVAVVVWWVGPVSAPVLTGAAVGVFCLGVVAATRLEARWGLDPGRVVIDEAVGMLLALLWVPATPLWVGAAWLWFRVFDVAKPFPCRRLEQVPGGWGVMLDDVMAGLYACGVVHVLVRLIS